MWTMKFGKIKTFESHKKKKKKNGSKSEIFHHPGSGNHEIRQKSKTFESPYKFGSNWRILITLVLQTMKFGKIKKSESRLKCGSNFRFSTTPLLCEPQNLAKSRNLSWVECGSNLRFLTTQGQGTMRFGNIKKFESHWKFDLNLDFLTILILKQRNIAKSRNLSHILKLRLSNLRFSSTPVLLTMKFGNIHYAQDRGDQQPQIWAKSTTPFKYLYFAKFEPCSKFSSNF